MQNLKEEIYGWEADYTIVYTKRDNWIWLYITRGDISERFFHTIKKKATQYLNIHLKVWSSVNICHTTEEDIVHTGTLKKYLAYTPTIIPPR
jgi:hypothetical protein